MLQVYVSSLHTASVNSLSFAPHELGLIIASASSDGCIGIIMQQLDGSFTEDKVCPLLQPSLMHHTVVSRHQ